MKNGAAIERNLVSEILSSDYRGRVSPSEYAVLMFIFDRTHRFRKQAEVIPIRHFVHGIVARNGDVVTPGVGLSGRQVIRVLQVLAKLNLVTVKYDKRKGNTYAINIHPFYARKSGQEFLGSDTHVTTLVTPASLPYTVNNTILKFPRINTRKGCASMFPKPPNLGNTAPSAYGASPPPTPLEKVRAVALAAAAKSSAARAAKKAKPNVTGMLTTWLDTVIEYNPELEGVIGAIKMPAYMLIQLKRLPGRGFPVEETGEFFRYVVENWQSCMIRLHGKNASSAQEVPDIRIVIKYVDRLYAMFSQKDKVRQIAQLTPDMLARVAKDSEAKTAKLAEADGKLNKARILISAQDAALREMQRRLDDALRAKLLAESRPKMRVLVGSDGVARVGAIGHTPNQQALANSGLGKYDDE